MDVYQRGPCMVGFLNGDALVTLFRLALLEIILGIDNIVFLAILVDRLPRERQSYARRMGLFPAMCMRILLLCGISWLMKLTLPLFTVFEVDISGKDLILLLGGLFLIAKATHEIHHKLEGVEEEQKPGGSIVLRVSWCRWS